MSLQEGENNLFVEFLLVNNGLSTWLKPYLNDIDLIMIKMSCKRLNKEISKIPKDPKDSKGRALELGYFKIYCWKYNNNFDKIASLFSTYRYSIPFSDQDFEFQKKIISKVFEDYESLKDGIRYMTTSNTDEKRFEFYVDLFLIPAAQMNNNKLMIWLNSELLKGKCTESQQKIICYEFAKHGNLTMLEWLRKQNFQWDENTMLKAVEYNHFNLLTWLIDQQCPYHSRVLDMAKKVGNVAF